ncbi:hypothetical protein BGX29_005313 [Mortierella sp. GBA35]|nr:hypothetical protein BGX29_005313 [Mortierella sp. GBA35]
MPPLILIILAPILVAALIFGGTILFAPKSSPKDIAATTATPKYPSDEAAVMMTRVPPAIIITDTQIPKAVPSAGISLSPIPKDDDKKDREKTDDEGEDDDDIEWEDDEQEDDVDKKPKVNETSSTQSSHSKDSRHVVNAIQLEEGQMPKKIPMKTWKFFKSRRSVASKKGKEGNGESLSFLA